MSTLIDVKTAAVLEGAGIFIGMAFVISMYTVTTYGVGWKLNVDNDRQKVLAVTVAILAIVGMIKHGQQVTSSDIMTYNVLLLLQWIMSLFSLCIINHNSLVRFAVAISNSYISATMISRLTVLLYFMIMICISPAIMAAVEQYPKKNLSASRYATTDFKLTILILIIITEAIATVSDVLLIRKVTEGKIDGVVVRSAVKRDMKYMYWSIWVTLVLDITFKTVSVAGIFTPNFDSHCTNFTMALRACTNLRFGTTLIDVVQGTYNASSHQRSGTHNGSRVALPGDAPAATPRSRNQMSTNGSPPSPFSPTTSRNPLKIDTGRSQQNLAAPDYYSPRHTPRGSRPSTKNKSTRSMNVEKV